MTVQVQGQKIALAVERMGKVAPMVRLRMLELREPRDEAEVKEIMGMLSRVIPKVIDDAPPPSRPIQTCWHYAYRV